ncbi:MAG: hypothetical protein KGL39_25980 [Patescibacteria group bacterium]|nr:hypothetical protein [Patescibacteria group bacterium]
MKTAPQTGEVWFADTGYDAKPRYYLVMAVPGPGRLDLFSAIQITKQFGGTPFEVTLPRVPWLSEQSYINAQTIQPLLRPEFVRTAPGKFELQVFRQVQAALKLWLNL